MKYKTCLSHHVDGTWWKLLANCKETDSLWKIDHFVLFQLFVTSSQTVYQLYYTGTPIIVLKLLMFFLALCNKFLDSTSSAEHDGQLFCKTCHGRKFGPKVQNWTWKLEHNRRPCTNINTKIVLSYLQIIDWLIDRLIRATGSAEERLDSPWITGNSSATRIL